METSQLTSYCGYCASDLNLASKLEMSVQLVDLYYTAVGNYHDVYINTKSSTVLIFFSRRRIMAHHSLEKNENIAIKGVETPMMNR